MQAAYQLLPAGRVKQFAPNRANDLMQQDIESLLRWHTISQHDGCPGGLIVEGADGGSTRLIKQVSAGSCQQLMQRPKLEGLLTDIAGRRHLRLHAQQLRTLRRNLDAAIEQICLPRDKNPVTPHQNVVLGLAKSARHHAGRPPQPLVAQLGKRRSHEVK